MANRGDFLEAPDIYMDKLAAGPEGVGVCSLAMSPSENVRALAKAKGKAVRDMVIVVLGRPRHEKLIAELRSLGSSVRLITDGDVNPCVATGMSESGIDMFLGIGGAPEGVLAAAALKCLGGVFEGRLVIENEQQRARAIGMGIGDPEALLRHEDMVRGPCFFVASGVTDGPMLAGVRKIGPRTIVASLALRSDTMTIRRFETSTLLSHLPVDER